MVEPDLGWRREEELFNVVAAIVGKLKMVPFLWRERERGVFIQKELCKRIGK